MPGKPGQGPKPAETTPKPSAPKAPEKKDAKKETKESQAQKTADQLKEAFGGMDFLGSVKGVMESWAKLWQVIMNLGDELDNFKFEQDPVKMQKILSAWEEKIKVPEIQNKEALKTKIEKPIENEEMVAYLYRTIGLPMPDVKELQPPTDKVKLPYFIMQLKRSLVYLTGRKSITEGFMKDKPDFKKGDMVVFRDKFKKGEDQFKAGFVVAFNKTNVYIRNNESDEPQKFPASQLFVAFQIPGNSQNGKAPEYPGEKDDKKKKDKAS